MSLHTEITYGIMISIITIIVMSTFDDIMTVPVHIVFWLILLLLLCQYVTRHNDG